MLCQLEAKNRWLEAFPPQSDNMTAALRGMSKVHSESSIANGDCYSAG